jgi:hypothetical protein
MAQQARGLTWRPIVPGSALHLSLLSRALTPREQLGAVLYPSLHQRQMARRACAVIAAAGASVGRTKQNAPVAETEAFTAPRYPVDVIEDGCTTECA